VEILVHVFLTCVLDGGELSVNTAKKETTKQRRQRDSREAETQPIGKSLEIKQLLTA
jgi:hypothetical protein